MSMNPDTTSAPRVPKFNPPITSTVMSDAEREIHYTAMGERAFPKRLDADEYEYFNYNKDNFQNKDIAYQVAEGEKAMEEFKNAKSISQISLKSGSIISSIVSSIRNDDSLGGFSNNRPLGTDNRPQFGKALLNKSTKSSLTAELNLYLTIKKQQL